MILNQRDRLMFSICEGDSLTELLCTLLSLGKPINLKEINGFNSLMVLLKENTCSHQSKLQNPDSDLKINPEPALILFAAGEVLQLQHLTVTVTTTYIPECITQESNQFTLQNACRKAIRKRLLGIDFHAHLFNRIDKLGLPAPVRSYLLFNIHPEIEEACKSPK